MTKTDLIQQAIGLQEQINQLILKHRTRNWLSLNLTINQLKSVIYIYSKGKVNATELAGALNVTPSVVTGIVDRLIRHGVVNRKRLDMSADGSTDRRMQWLMITDKGRALIDSTRQQMSEKMSQILEMMSTEDLSALIQGFSGFMKAAESYDEAETSRPI